MNQEHTLQQQINERNKSWPPEANKLLRHWKCQIQRRQDGHIKYSNKYNKRHYMLGVPAVIIGIIVASGVFMTFQNCDPCEKNNKAKCTMDLIVRFIMGVLSIIGTAFSATNTFLNYSSESEKHKNAASTYGSLYRNISTLLLTPKSLRGEPTLIIRQISNQYDNISRDAPSLPDKYQVILGYNYKCTDDVIKSIHYDNDKSEGTESNGQEEINKLIEKENSYDTSDEEHDVVVTFDIDEEATQHEKVEAVIELTSSDNISRINTLNSVASSELINRRK